MKRRGNKRVANRLVALGSAAVLTVYAAGFLRTRAAAQKLAGADQRRVAPAPAEAGGSSVPPQIKPPASIAKAEASQRSRSVKLDVTRAATRPAPKRSPTTPAKTASATTSASAPASTAAVTTPPPDPATPAATAAATTTATTTVPATVVPVIEPPPPPKPVSLYKDGTYYGWGTSRHGDIQASVVIADGRIASASITQCLTRYSCSWIAHLPPQVVSRQSPECDYVSGATQSTNAFYYAVVEALSKAK